MEFRKCSIAGIVYGYDFCIFYHNVVTNDNTVKALTRLLLCVCNTPLRRVIEFS